MPRSLSTDFVLKCNRDYSPLVAERERDKDFLYTYMNNKLSVIGEPRDPKPCVSGKVPATWATFNVQVKKRGQPELISLLPMGGIEVK